MVIKPATWGQEGDRRGRAGEGGGMMEAEQGDQEAQLWVLKMEEGPQPWDAGASNSWKRQGHQKEPTEGTAMCAPGFVLSDSAKFVVTGRSSSRRPTRGVTLSNPTLCDWDKE